MVTYIAIARYACTLNPLPTVCIVHSRDHKISACSRTQGRRSGNVHISPLYTMAHSRDIKGLSAMVIICSLAVFTCGFWCTRAHIRQVGVYEHTCTVCPDIGTCSRCMQMSKPMHGGTEYRESKRTLVTYSRQSSCLYTCGSWCTRADIRHELKGPPLEVVSLYANEAYKPKTRRNGSQHKTTTKREHQDV